MADSMQFDLVSPERSLASLEVASVLIPGSEGDMTALPNHAATITTLRPGILSVSHAGGTDDYVVTGGFAEIGTGGVSVLAERAVAKGDLAQDQFDAILADARQAQASASESGEGVDLANKVVADLTAVGSELGLNVG